MFRPPRLSPLSPSTPFYRSPRRRPPDRPPVDRIDPPANVRDLTPHVRRELPALLVHERVVHHRSEEHTSELQSRQYLVCRLLLEKKNSRQIILCRILL